MRLHEVQGCKYIKVHYMFIYTNYRLYIFLQAFSPSKSAVKLQYVPYLYILIHFFAINNNLLAFLYSFSVAKIDNGMPNRAYFLFIFYMYFIADIFP